MKLAYERPVMRAEMYQTSGYVAACSNPNLLETVVTTLLGNWIHLSKSFLENNIEYSQDANNNGITDAIESLSGQYDFTHEFAQGSKNTFVADWYNNAQQYYWHATGDDGKTYYLEYSQEWTDEHAENGGNRGDGSVFVLYQETSSSANGLQVNSGGFLGTPDNFDNPWGADTPGADKALAGIYFEKNAVYWS